MSCKWVNDSQRFLWEYFDLIGSSPFNIHHSALPFCPTSSWLREYYSTDLSQEVKVVKGLQTEWGKCTCTITTCDSPPPASWKDLVAFNVNLNYEIEIHNAITGTCISILSGHTHWLDSVAFSSDGRYLVSGSCDKTVKLWDIQTGGDIKTFHGHTGRIDSVSISWDCTTIASGSRDKTIRLWDTQTGECHHIIDEHKDRINIVIFSPTNSQLLISASEDNTIRWWDVNGHQISPTYEGNNVALSSDGALFVSCGKSAATVQNSNTGAVVAELQVSGKNPQCCCFSPDDKFVLGGIGHIIYIWEITNSGPHLVETLVGHMHNIRSLTFSSSFVSYSSGQIKFWQISTVLADQVATNSESIQCAPAPIKSITLQAYDGIAISCDSTGVVRIWDISTGHCKGFFHTPVQNFVLIDAWLINNRLMVVWYRDKVIYVWDNEKGELLCTIAISCDTDPLCLRISGDGSKKFLQGSEKHIQASEKPGILPVASSHIQALDIWTGEVVSETKLECGGQFPGSLVVNGSRFGVRFVERGSIGDEDNSVGATGTQWWDLGTVGITPILLSNTPLDRPHLDFLCNANIYSYVPSQVEDTTNGKVVFWLFGRHGRHSDTQWDGRYLVAGYESGEVLILDFDSLPPQ